MPEQKKLSKITDTYESTSSDISTRNISGKQQGERTVKFSKHAKEIQESDGPKIDQNLYEKILKRLEMENQAKSEQLLARASEKGIDFPALQKSMQEGIPVYMQHRQEQEWLHPHLQSSYEYPQPQQPRQPQPFQTHLDTSTPSYPQTYGQRQDIPRHPHLQSSYEYPQPQQPRQPQPFQTHLDTSTPSYPQAYEQQQDIPRYPHLQSSYEYPQPQQPRQPQPFQTHLDTSTPSYPQAYEQQQDIPRYPHLQSSYEYPQPQQPRQPQPFQTHLDTSTPSYPQAYEQQQDIPRYPHLQSSYEYPQPQQPRQPQPFQTHLDTSTPSYPQAYRQQQDIPRYPHLQSSYKYPQLQQPRQPRPFQTHPDTSTPSYPQTYGQQQDIPRHPQPQPFYEQPARETPSAFPSQLDRPSQAAHEQPLRTQSSGYLTILSHHSIEHFPSDTLQLFSEGNQKIAEQHEQFKIHQTEHITNSKREILQTARIALNRMPERQPKKALLLGVGNGLDIPLRELAETFDELTLIELDERSTKNAISQLPSELQKKFRLIVADMTGISGKLCKISRESIISSNSVEQATIRLTKIIDSIKQKITIESTPNLGTDYAFVSSQLVLSQLGNIPREYIQTTAENRFGMRLTSDDLSRHRKDLDNSLHKEHIRYLARSVAPLGTVHFADTYEVRKLDTVDMPVVPMVNSSIIDSAIQATFKPIRNKVNWHFLQAPTHRRFHVTSSSLELR